MLFGVGSIAGMATLLAIIAVPLCYSFSSRWAHTGLQALVGVTTLYVGGMMVYDIGITGGLLVVISSPCSLKWRPIRRSRIAVLTMRPIVLTAWPHRQHASAPLWPGLQEVVSLLP